MKILFVIESLGNGGAERALISTINILIKRGVSCEVATLFEEHDLLSELERNGVVVHQLNVGFRWNVFKILSQLKALLTNRKYDIVDTHLFFAHFYVGILKTIRFPQLKTIVTLHNLGYQADPATTVIKKFRKLLDKQSLNTFDIKLAVSKSVKNHFIDELNLNDVKVLHNGFVVKEFSSPQGSKPLVFSSDKMNILTPGRLVKEKGHEFLIKAIIDINKSVHSLHFFFAGDGHMKEVIENLIVEHDIDNITLLGNLEQQELFNYILYADLIVIPSVSEGFGMVVGESMVLNKAILATNVGGIPDFIDNGINGIMVNAKSHTELKENIELLINNDDLRKQLGAAARQKVQIFNIDKIVEKRIEIYKKLIS
ncbi:glycosyltransferase family 4 protein [Chryseobacterium caseinilyticum]|uniref:Glycosyltransferase family 4 protein n=1 Tax=Chryseobacterium caseinilyticum TaxID=2771428 RepID=A0ABR8ZH56_9FLAO|nr:glycosyltransferase family 4 protein [Chryseobacterium caseinilyticum]MBD8084615.1 glycosyltransferase family 4 protein [Chryseobacterium caseinilyticum]